MSDLQARERVDPDWETPVVDLVEEGEVVGLVYSEEGQLLAEFYPDDDGEAHLFDVADLQRVFDAVAGMLSGKGEQSVRTPAIERPPSVGTSPVELLAAEFDRRAVRRGPEDEGFYPLDAAMTIVRRCGDLDLAVVSLDGFLISGESMRRASGCSADLGAAYRGEPWPTFIAGCNLQAQALLERWPRRTGLAVAFEVQDASGEVFVL
jgi:hypothetical protein